VTHEDYDQAPGFPAETTRVKRRRSVPTALSGQSPGMPAHNAKPVAAEYGWLTPLRKSKGDPRLWFWRCRCGAEITREIGHVRRCDRLGKVSRCKTCQTAATTTKKSRGAAP
jgi:hypothetical protein